MVAKREQWAGRWKGGRYSQNADGKRVFWIEKMVDRRRYAVRLETHDEDLALGELVRFLADPIAFTKPVRPDPSRDPLHVTPPLLAAYLESIKDTVKDHRKARGHYLRDWSTHGLDLRTASLDDWRVALAKFGGGHRGRVEAINAFGNWLVATDRLERWKKIANPYGTKSTRAEQRAYSLDELRAAWARLPAGPVRDVFLLRASTGLHHTEVQQLVNAPVYRGPLPQKGPAIRELDAGNEIAGVLQVRHKSRKYHRQSIDAEALAAALRLRARVPDRVTMWEALNPLVPSNLRHTFITLAGEVGRLVTFQSAGVERARIAQAVGHRAGSTMTADRYDKMQVPPMIVLPLRLSESTAAPHQNSLGRDAA